MIVKLIRCRMEDGSHDRFMSGQQRWRPLAQVQGFVGQIGGWRADDSDEAVIIGLWRDKASYEAFMSDVHDRLFERTGQKGSYSSSEVSLWDCLLDMPGVEPALPEAIGGGALIRIALGEVLPDRHDHFQQVQRDIWVPGMNGAPGMLAGVFSRSLQDDSKYLVCTLWESAGAHAAYRADTLPALRERAAVEGDCRSLEGFIVPVEPSWRVTLGK